MDTTKVGITVSPEAVKKGEESMVKPIAQTKKEPKKKKEVKDAEQRSD